MDQLTKHNVTIIRYSCLTGKAVWIYQGLSRHGGRQAYLMAWKKELERVKNWREHVMKRKATIMKILNDCMANQPITGELSPEKQAAARTLLKLAETEPECYRGFYDHIIEERRRRAEDAEIRRQMREREKKA